MSPWNVAYGDNRPQRLVRDGEGLGDGKPPDGHRTTRMPSGGDRMNLTGERERYDNDEEYIGERK
jgi:hypothetical protein